MSSSLRFHLVFGICLRDLCLSQASDPAENICICLEAMKCLLDSSWARGRLTKEVKLAIELCNVLHRLLLTRDLISVQVLVFQVVDHVVLAARERLDLLKRQKLKSELAFFFTQLFLRASLCRGIWISKVVTL